MEPKVIKPVIPADYTAVSCLGKLVLGRFGGAFRSLFQTCSRSLV